MVERFYYAEDKKVQLTPSSAFVAIQTSPGAVKAAMMADVDKAEGQKGTCIGGNEK